MISCQLFIFYFFGAVWFIRRNHDDSRVTTIRCENLISGEECRCKRWSRELHIKRSIVFQIILTFDNCIIKCVSDNLLLLLLQHLRRLLLLFWIRLRLNLLLLFLSNFNKLCYVICKFHFYHKRTLCSILSMTITHGKEMLMKSLTHVWRKNKVILVLFIWVVDGETFTSGISKTSYNISVYTFCSFIFIKTFNFKRCLCCVLYSIIIIYSLVLKDHIWISLSVLWGWWTFYYLLYNLLWT